MMELLCVCTFYFFEKRKIIFVSHIYSKFYLSLLCVCTFYFFEKRKIKFGVYVAYKYYLSLFKKIKRTHAQKLLEQRIRIPNYSKAFIVVRAGIKNQLNLI